MNKKNKIFCEEYLIDLNATQAAIRAGYSPKTANEQGSQLLAKLSIRTYIDKALAERSKRTGVTTDRVIEELARVAFAKLTDVAEITNNELSVKGTATDDDKAAIASIKIKKYNSDKGESVETEIKMHDKITSLIKLGEHLGMFTKSNLPINISVNFSGEENLED